MTRAIALCTCGLALANCSGPPSMSSNPSFPLFSPRPVTAVLAIESDPPGAQASASAGGSCRTPCTLSVPLEDFSVSYALNGYAPQTVPVRVVQGVRTGTIDRRQDVYEGITDNGIAPPPPPHLDPNPVFAMLRPTAPPVRRRPAAAAQADNIR